MLPKTLTVEQRQREIAVKNGSASELLDNPVAFHYIQRLDAGAGTSQVAKSVGTPQGHSCQLMEAYR